MPALTPYIDLYRNLNTHLHETTDTNQVPPRTLVLADTRKGPRITNDEQTIRANLKKTFGFTDALYSPHTYYYPKQVTAFQKPTFLSNKVLINVNYRWCTEYFHFLTEALPNAMTLYARYPTAILLCTKSQFTERMFRWFNVYAPIVEQKQPILCEATASFVECGNPSREKIELLRSVVESKLTFESTTGILIRRHKTRFVDNEAELFEECKERFPDLDWVIYDMLSPEDTATLFSKAAVIVAPHGAGLTNMLFSKRGISIYEFMPMDEPNLCYWHLSEMLGNRYTMIPTRWSGANSMHCNFPHLL